MHIAKAFLVQGGKILLGKRSAKRTFYPNVWDMIGGHVEENETPFQTLSRELCEEIGVIPTCTTLLAIQDAPYSEIDGQYQHYIYVVTMWKGTPSNLQPDEHDEVSWFTPEEAIKLDLADPSYVGLFKQIAVELL